MTKKQQQTIILVSFTLMLVVLALCSGCKTLLPSGTDLSSSKWKTYQQAENTISKIIPNKTKKRVAATRNAIVFLKKSKKIFII